MKRLILASTALALGLGPALADDQVTAWRLFVADHAEPVVHAIDALEGRIIESFDLSGPATLHRSDSGQAIYAVQGAVGEVATIASGIAFHDHGDHADIDLDEPRLTGATFTGQRPSHFVEHHGQWAAFFDGDGAAQVFAETDALGGKAEPRPVDAGQPHHGVVIPLGDLDLVSVPNPEDPSQPPVGVRLVDREGNQAGDTTECVGLHGEASSGNLIALGGCPDGILILRMGAEGPQIQPLNIGGALPEGRISTLIGGRGLQYFMGNHGPQAIVLIDPNEEPAFRRIELPTRRVHFAVDPIRARFAYVFTEDGQLHQIDVIEGEIARSLRVTDPYSMDGHWGDPRPRVAVAGDWVLVTDPLSSRIHRIDAESFEVTGEIAVEGAPFNIVSVGGTGVDHGHDHDHDHDHDHEEGHDHAH